MALKVPQSSFSKGELDPILHERTTLQAFKNGLATARNWVVGKTGSVFTRQPRMQYLECKLDNREVKCYCPPTSGYLLEFGHLYVRIYNADRVLVADLLTTFTEPMLPYLHFDTSKTYVYVFCISIFSVKIDYVNGVFVSENETYGFLEASVSFTASEIGPPTGYIVDYAVSLVMDGEESLVAEFTNTYKLPISTGQSNLIDVVCGATVDFTGHLTEIRVYRRPTGGAGYGFIGSSTGFYISGGNTKCKFSDFGQSADYAHAYPMVIWPFPPVTVNPQGRTGIIYQQRLLVNHYSDPESIFASRPALYRNFFRNYPLDSDSALKFKSGTSGHAQVLRMIEADGLVVFTSAGVFLNVGPLGPTNISLEKKGKWIINHFIPPLAVPGGVFFVDIATNTIRNLLWSTELAGYNGQELSIFSDHIFREREIKSWAFQEGSLPLLWVSFTDGTYASFTWEFDQEMKAWTRHDSQMPIEQIVGTGVPDITYFVVKKGTKRYIEYTIPRFLPPAYRIEIPESDKNNIYAFMDSMVSYDRLMNNYLVGTDLFVLTPVTPEDWGGNLTLTCGSSGIFDTVNEGKVGEIFRMFDEDKTAYDLKVVSRTNDNSVVVKPDKIFPEYKKSGARLFWTFIELTGLDHLNGEFPSVIVDGAVIASPNNDIENYDVIGVAGGKITLPEKFRAAAAHVGRPIVADIETLDIDTVEQAPTVIESKTVNKLYMKVHQSKGLYVGHKFPPNDKVNNWTTDATTAMIPLEEYTVDNSEEDPIIGNRYKPPESKRYEITLRGDWKSNGKIAIRQVDPLHSQILSIIPDVEVLQRSDR